MHGQTIVGSLSVPADELPDTRLAALFDVHHERIYRLARRLAPSADDALDLVQETFLRAARKVSAVPLGAEREEAWLVRVLVNLQRDQWRKSAIRKRYEERTDHQSATADHEPAVVARATIWRALHGLAPRRRAVVIMRELEELPVRTIASLLGITPITVRWHLAMGRRDLRRALTTMEDPE